MHSKNLICLLSAACVFAAGSATADVWVFEPSISLDQRFDDNYFLEPSGDGELSATRAVGELGLSRESAVAVVKGLVRIDGLLTTQSDAGEEGLESNQLIAFDAKMRSARTRYGVFGSFKQDTPSRDIAADLSDPDSLSTDTGLNPTQSSNVARQEITIKPYFNFDMTRRLEFSSTATLTFVEHELPDVQDAIYQRYYNQLQRDEQTGNIVEEVLPYNEVTITDAEASGVFSPSGELDDFTESEIEVGLRYKYNPISTLTFKVAFSKFNAEVEIDPFAFVPFEDLIADSRELGIRRVPRRDSLSTTTSFEIGYERFLTPTLQLGVAAGVYTNTSDRTDTLRVDDNRPNEEVPAEQLDALKSDTDGWLASVGITRDAGLTRYVGKFSVDVQPSSSGAQVETQELTGDVFRVLSPRMNLSFRARAFEPDRLGANESDRFARRFISLEPKIEWKYARNWTVSAAYRYRRQKARVDPVPAESNAILLALKYTPPSKIRDAARASGL